ncbi:KEOPS complex subunit Pcc1 [Halosimplex aquaticum]|uniref:KEOPS complex subunit Pcc1 n=1 Tax=Halosimplex aquaticum TaxID=3026162 RepID=A0ABD5XZA0_9EURY|nr:KEOPS complex subunit Pcc1 [Halosimplex aquaticum]
MRRATITTTHGDEEAATRVAAALAPDNTAEMDTRVDGDAVVTAVTRETTGGLRSTVDDYVVNCRVASRLGAEGDDGDEDHAERSTAQTDDTPDTDTNT